MKKFFVIVAAIFTVYSLSFGQKAGKKTAKTDEARLEIKTSMDSISYSYGMDIGKYFLDLEKMGVKVSIELISKGINDFTKKGKTLLTNEEVTKILGTFAQAMQAKQKEQMEKQKEQTDKMKNEIGDKNIKEGAKFLEENKTKEGVKVTASGLQYKVLTEGTGKQPTLADTVTVHYAGRTIDGKEFDSSYKRGQPATFPLGGVIDGWKEGLQLMKEGSKYQIYIPSNLGYGDSGAGESIPPYSTLIFDVELIKVGNK